MSLPTTQGLANPGIAERRSTLALHVRGSELSHLPIGSMATPVFSRASANVGRDAKGAFYLAAHSQPVVECYDLDGDGIYETPALVFDGARTNLCPYGADLSQLTLTNLSRSLNADRLGALVLTKLTDADTVHTGIGETPIMAARFSVAGNGVFLVQIAAPDSPPAAGNEILLWDSTAGASRGSLVAQWLGGTGTFTGSGGATALWCRRLGISARGKNVYEVALKAAGTLTTSDHKLRIAPATTAAQTGDAYIGYLHVEDVATCPGSLVVNPGTTSLSYAAEVWGLPIDAYCSPVTMYLDFIERGGILTTARLLSIGSSAGAAPGLILEATGGFYRIRHHNGTAAVTSTAATAPTIGDRVQLYGILNADGSVQLQQRITSPASGTPGAFVAATASAVNTLAATWSGFPGATSIYLGHAFANAQKLRLFEGKVALAARTLAQIQAAF